MKTARKAQSEGTMCKCLEKVNKKLISAGLNTQVSTTFQVELNTGRARVLPALAVEKLDLTVRGRPRPIIPTFCPFCGNKYPDTYE